MAKKQRVGTQQNAAATESASTENVAPPPPPPLELEVRGRPVPKGAMTAFVVPGKVGQRARAVVAAGGTKAKRSALAEWQSAIQDAALVAMGAREVEVERFVGVGVELEVEFRLARPASHYGTGKNADKLKASAPPFPASMPDVDKLVRAVFDALIGTAFHDDGQISTVIARKRYAERGQLEGARIRIAAQAERVAPVLALVPSTVRAQGGPGTLGELLGLATARLERPGDAALYPPSRPQTAEPPEGSELADEQSAERRQARIRAATQGTLFAAEAEAFAPSKPLHAIAKHAVGTLLEETLGDVAVVPRDEFLEGILERDPMLRAAVEDRVAACEDLDSVIARGDRAELSRRFLACDVHSPEHAKILEALATNKPPPMSRADIATALQVEDDFG